MYKEENNVLRGVYIDCVNYRYQYDELLQKYKLLEVFLDNLLCVIGWTSKIQRFSKASVI